jgi:UDP-N-acetylglucosamine 2-epimerase (non-hydrolysing)
LAIKIINIVGARPNFMKIAPLMAAYARTEKIKPLLVHTGQHYDSTMSDLFFSELGIPQPDLNLGVGSGSHAKQTAQIMTSFEPVLLEHKPDAVLVVGDVNSTIACGLVAVKLGIKLIHVEAGLRSFDRTMPEEINRLLTDAVSDMLFCTEQSGVDNLSREGVPAEKVFLVGNLMIDTLLRNRDRAERSTILEKLHLTPRHYAVLTLHRPSNVDDPVALRGLMNTIAKIQEELPVVFPVHPRTRKILAESGQHDRLAAMKGLHLTEPLGYLDFLKLTASAKIVLTDSGGIQEETTILQVPCLTLRENTERPVTAEIGSSYIVGANPEKILATFRKVMRGEARPPQIPALWDGQAAERTVQILHQKL